MNTKILTQLLPASSAPAPSGRGADAADSAPAENFFQVMLRVGAEARPRPEPTGARHDAAAKKADAREPAESKAPGAAPTKQAKKPDAPAGEAAQGASTTAPAGTVAETDTDAPANSAADLIEALLLPATVGQPAMEVPLVPVVSEPTAQVTDGEKGNDDDAGATANSTSTPAGTVPLAESAQATERTGSEPRSKSVRAMTSADNSSPLNTAPATAQSDQEVDAAAGQARAPMIVAQASARRAMSNTTDKSAVPVLPQAAPQRAPIAEALAALAARSDAGDVARAVAREHRFDQLLDARALSAPRAEPAAQAVPFASLLQTASAPTTTATVATPFDQPGFAQDFGNRVLLLASGQVKSAELALTPAELGPVRVSIEMRGQDASIAFVASAAATRAALEEALPRLRELFAQQGLNLLDASVGAHVGQQGQRADARASAPRGRGREQGDTDATLTAVATPAPLTGGRPVRLIDVIA